MASFSLYAPENVILGRGCFENAAVKIGSFGKNILIFKSRSAPGTEHLINDLTKIDKSVMTVNAEKEPTASALSDALEVARKYKPDCIVSLGGGSAIDLGKAVAGLYNNPILFEILINPKMVDNYEIEGVLPFIAIPTTAGTGAEATKNAVISVPSLGIKKSIRHNALMPNLAIIDPALTDNMPRNLTLATGLDAVTQLTESYLSRKSNSLTQLICASHIESSLMALKNLMRGGSYRARDIMCNASYASGLSLANSGLGVIHGIASVIGVRGAPHGAICGRLLSPGLKVNELVMRNRGLEMERMDKVRTWIANALNVQISEAFSALDDFVNSNGLPRLKDMSICKNQISDIAASAKNASSTKSNPVTLEHEEVSEILRLAF